MKELITLLKANIEYSFRICSTVSYILYGNSIIDTLKTTEDIAERIKASILKHIKSNSAFEKSHAQVKEALLKSSWILSNCSYTPIDQSKLIVIKDGCGTYLCNKIKFENDVIYFSGKGFNKACTRNSTDPLEVGLVTLV